MRILALALCALAKARDPRVGEVARVAAAIRPSKRPRPARAGATPVRSHTVRSRRQINVLAALRTVWRSRYLPGTQKVLREAQGPRPSDVYVRRRFSREQVEFSHGHAAVETRWPEGLQARPRGARDASARGPGETKASKNTLTYHTTRRFLLQRLPERV